MKESKQSLPAAVRQLVGSGWDTSPRKYLECAACGVPVWGRLRKFDSSLRYSGKFVCRLCIHQAGDCRRYLYARCDKYCKVR